MLPSHLLGSYTTPKNNSSFVLESLIIYTNGLLKLISIVFNCSGNADFSATKKAVTAAAFVPFSFKSIYVLEIKNG